MSDTQTFITVMTIIILTVALAFWIIDKTGPWNHE